MKKTTWTIEDGRPQSNGGLVAKVESEARTVKGARAGAEMLLLQVARSIACSDNGVV
jgi:hypothetical protein